MAHSIIGIEPFFYHYCWKANIGRLYGGDGNNSRGVSENIGLLSNIVKDHSVSLLLDSRVVCSKAAAVASRT